MAPVLVHRSAFAVIAAIALLLRSAAAASTATAHAAGVLAPNFNNASETLSAGHGAYFSGAHLFQDFQRWEHSVLVSMRSLHNMSWEESMNKLSADAWHASFALSSSHPDHEDESSSHPDHDVDHDHDDDDGLHDYDLFQRKDLVPWIVFICVFTVLIVFDNTVLHGKDDEELSFRTACCYTVFWLACAACFNIYVYWVRGFDDAVNWGTGYLLEWMLSVDNLFVFRSIFVTFATPDKQKHKPLFWGIIGAIFFRMLFFIVEEVLLHTFSFMYVLLGLFLIYTGVKIMVIDDCDEVEPESDPLLKKITERLPYVNKYAPKPLFFARVEDLRTGRSASDTETPRTRFDDTQPLRATKLLLVVICLELTDIVFAVDSVSAIVAQIPDLFLAYTACVFAMLGLRAMFFVVDEMVKLFSLLSYGVALILVFIGLKLCFRGYIHIPHGIVCGILVSTLFLSILASWVWTTYIKKPDEEEDEAAKDDKKDFASWALESGLKMKEIPEDSQGIAARS